ncbi:MAG: hypothetical protein ACI9SG_001386 [Maribacter sp.]
MYGVAQESATFVLIPRWLCLGVVHFKRIQESTTQQYHFEHDAPQ